MQILQEILILAVCLSLSLGVIAGPVADQGSKKIIELLCQNIKKIWKCFFFHLKFELSIYIVIIVFRLSGLTSLVLIGRKELHFIVTYFCKVIKMNFFLQYIFAFLLHISTYRQFKKPVDRKLSPSILKFLKGDA